MKRKYALQRFNQANLLKRTIFELIAQELLQTLMPDSRDPSSHGDMPEACVATGCVALPLTSLRMLLGVRRVLSWCLLL